MGPRVKPMEEIRPELELLGSRPKNRGTSDDGSMAVAVMVELRRICADL